MDPTLTLILATLAFLALHIVPSTPLRALAVQGARRRRLPRAVLPRFARRHRLDGGGFRGHPVRGAVARPAPRADPRPAPRLRAARLRPAGAEPDPRRPGARAERARAGARHSARHTAPDHVGDHAVVGRAPARAGLAQGGGVLRRVPAARRRGHHAAGRAQGHSASASTGQRFAAATSNVPFAAIARGRNKLVWREIGWWRPATGLALFALLLYFHPWLFGYRPF